MKQKDYLTITEQQLADYFRKKREQSGLSRPKLAELLGIDTTIVTNYELKRTRIQLPVFLALMNKFSYDLTIPSLMEKIGSLSWEPSATPGWTPTPIEEILVSVDGKVLTNITNIEEKVENDNDDIDWD